MSRYIFSVRPAAFLVLPCRLARRKEFFNPACHRFIAACLIICLLLTTCPRPVAGQVPRQVEVCDFDDCGVCRGGNKDKGCDGVCFSGKVIDSCGVCDGHNTDKGCDDICFSGKVVDTCGVCGGLDEEKGCDGICDSGKVYDCLNQCGGSAVDRGCGCATRSRAMRLLTVPTPAATTTTATTATTATTTTTTTTTTATTGAGASIGVLCRDC